MHDDELKRRLLELADKATPRPGSDLVVVKQAKLKRKGLGAAAALMVVALVGGLAGATTLLGRRDGIGPGPGPEETRLNQNELASMTADELAAGLFRDDELGAAVPDGFSLQRIIRHGPDRTNHDYATVGVQMEGPVSYARVIFFVHPSERDAAEVGIRRSESLMLNWKAHRDGSDEAVKPFAVSDALPGSTCGSAPHLVTCHAVLGRVMVLTQSGDRAPMTAGVTNEELEAATSLIRSFSLYLERIYPGERGFDDGCPRSRGKPSGSRWTSPTVRVATGTRDGNDWVLCARTVERAQGEDRSAEALCMDWLYGDGRNSGMTCVFSQDAGQVVPLDESYFDTTSGPEWGYFFGAVPAASRSVELDVSSGDPILGDIHPAPDELDVPFQFFTLFAQPFAEGTLLLRDENGDVIRKRVMEHGLSRLVVTKDGDGEGTVTGYRTDSLFVYESCKAGGDASCREPRPVWIQCGNDCDAALDDARITLVADPAEGSRFAGWSGACTGTEACELTVDENLTVTAVFEASP